jgi:hypothetical protein
MFCADYLASFVFHAGLTAGVTVAFSPSSSSVMMAWIRAATGLRNAPADLSTGAPALPFVCGAAAGLCGGLAVFRFDFVRAAVTPADMPLERQLLRNLSSVPYSVAFYGIYFSLRTPGDIKSQAGWALVSSTCSVLAEAPFDHAKRTLFGNRRLMLGANCLYAPFAAMMLVGYDNALTRTILRAKDC